MLLLHYPHFLLEPLQPTSVFSMPPQPASKESGDEDNNEIPAEEAESFTLTRTNNDQLKTGAGEEMKRVNTKNGAKCS